MARHIYFCTRKSKKYLKHFDDVCGDDNFQMEMNERLEKSNAPFPIEFPYYKS